MTCKAVQFMEADPSSQKAMYHASNYTDPTLTNPNNFLHIIATPPRFYQSPTH